MVVQENNEVYIVENKDDATLSTVATRSIVSTSEKSFAKSTTSKPARETKRGTEVRSLTVEGVQEATCIVVPGTETPNIDEHS